MISAKGRLSRQLQFRPRAQLRQVRAAQRGVAGGVGDAGVLLGFLHQPAAVFGLGENVEDGS